MLGVLPGIIGSIQALEAIKLILGIGDALSGRLLAYDALEQSFRTFKVNRDPECPACSLDPAEIVIAEYDEYCMPHPVGCLTAGPSLSRPCWSATSSSTSSSRRRGAPGSPT